MKVLSFLIRCNIRKSLIVAVLSVISGLGSAGLIAVVNSTLQPRAQRYALGALARGCIHRDLGRHDRRWRHRESEKMGNSRDLTCLIEDVNVLSGAMQDHQVGIRIYGGDASLFRARFLGKQRAEVSRRATWHSCHKYNFERFC